LTFSLPANFAFFFLSLTFAWVLLLVVIFVCAAELFLLHRTRLGDLLHQHVPDRPRRRLFLASVSFFITFLAVRGLTYAIHHNIGPFHDVEMGGRHIHHLVWGILILLLVGYGWLVELGVKSTPASILAGRLVSILYGAGAALTLDEFALWLNLRDVYWAREGRASIDAVILFGALLSVGWWGAPFFRGVAREFLHLERRSQKS
jgi:hypothetical protein